jgi:DNA-binding IclR family transcriptional regulator
MSGLERFVCVLQLFDEQASVWTVPGMTEALGIPQSTVYRTVRSLVAAGMLEAATEGRYRLGAAFIAFDRLIRLTDPLIEAGRNVLRGIAADAGMPCVALLSRLYNDTVMCIAERSAGAVTLHSSYERGKPMPLVQGATSKVILAHLPQRRLARLLAGMENAPQKALQTPRDEFRSELAEIRKHGYCVTHGEIDSGLTGIAAPILCSQFGIVASLSLALPSLRVTDKLLSRLIASTVAGAAEIERALAEEPGAKQQRSKSLTAMR